jgi:Flp pilus assembly protein TadG
MKARFSNTGRSRRGAITIVSAILMVVLLALTAFAVDMGYIIVVRTQLQNAADASALAGTSQLLDQSLLTGTPNQCQAIANAVNQAQQFSHANTAGGVAVALPDNPSNSPCGDIVCGYLSNPADLSQQMDFTTFPNSVQVITRRDSTVNGSLSLFFARVMGVSSLDLTATATASNRDHITGFSIHTPGHSTCLLLPFALDVNTWNAVLAGAGPDIFTRDPKTGAVSGGSDGIHECKLFPLSNSGGGSALPPGNFGTINIGSAANSTAVLVRQILYGPNATDLSYYPNGVVQLDPVTGTLPMNGNTGVSAGCKAALTSIMGQPRVIPLYSSVAGPGNNAEYTIVGFAGVTILEVVLDGSLSSKHLTIQPCFAVDPNAIPGSTTTTPSYYVYSPVALTR